MVERDGAPWSKLRSAELTARAADVIGVLPRFNERAFLAIQVRERPAGLFTPALHAFCERDAGVRRPVIEQESP